MIGRRYVRILAAGVFAFALLMVFADQAVARRGHRQHGFRSGFRFHGHRHHHRSYYPFWGFHYYSYPYWPYYYEAENADVYRRFPAFRLPGFFHYPGAIGKGELARPDAERQTSEPLPKGAVGLNGREKQER